MIVVAPPITPIPLPSPPLDIEDECESFKPKKKGKGKKGGPVMSQRQNEENCILNVMPGPISTLVGTRLFNNNWERDNSFWGMLPWDLLYVEAENQVYPGALTYKYYIWNHDGRDGPNPVESRGWTFWAPRGMPQTINQDKELLKIMANSSADQLERFEVWMILYYFMLVSQSFAPSQCDGVGGR